MKTVQHLLAGTGMVLISSAFFDSTATLPALAQANERQIEAGQQCRSCPPLRREGEGHPTGTATGGTIGSSGGGSGSGGGSVSGSVCFCGSVGGTGSGSFAR
jgi:hypothetical protein